VFTGDSWGKELPTIINVWACSSGVREINYIIIDGVFIFWLGQLFISFVAVGQAGVFTPSKAPRQADH
jgi:hypothetical protein